MKKQLLALTALALFATGNVFAGDVYGDNYTPYTIEATIHTASGGWLVTTIKPNQRNFDIGDYNRGYSGVSFKVIDGPSAGRTAWVSNPAGSGNINGVTIDESERYGQKVVQVNGTVVS